MAPRHPPLWPGNPALLGASPPRRLPNMVAFKGTPMPSPNTAHPGLTSRIAHLGAAYHSAFETQFDPHAFRSDNFYAAQVLEKSIDKGSPELRAAARELEDLLRSLLERAGAQSIGDLDFDLDDESLGHVPARTSVRSFAAAPERRAAAAPGHVSFDSRDFVLLSQMRTQYRRTFGTFFDSVEFATNDLYARTLLALCLKSENAPLAALAREFLNDDGTPRLHRREGAADLDFDGGTKQD